MRVKETEKEREREYSDINRQKGRMRDKRKKKSPGCETKPVNFISVLNAIYIKRYGSFKTT